MPYIKVLANIITIIWCSSLEKPQTLAFPKKLIDDETRREVKELSHHNYRKNIYSVKKLK
jgi:hypothetical protein